MSNKLFTILFLSAFLSYSYRALSCSTTISGPTQMCPGSEYLYTAKSTHTSHAWGWSCSGCSVKDPGTGLWTTSFSYDEFASGFISLSSGQVEVKFSTNAGSATISYWNEDNSGTGFDTHDVSLTAPTSSAGSVTGLNYLQNCSSIENTYSLNPENSWVFNSWNKSSGLTTVSSSSSSIKVKAVSSTATSTQYVKANLKWKDQGNYTCHTKSFTKYIQLAGYPSANYINVEIEGIGDNVICANERSYIDAYYDYGSMDAWEWDLPPNWNTFVTGSFVRVTAPVGSSSYIRVRAHNTCGWTGWKSHFVQVDNCSGSIMLSPNPAASQIMLVDESSADNENVNNIT